MVDDKQYQIFFQGKAIAVPPGMTIRRALLDAGLTPHNRSAKWLNCKGMGTCGTCAIAINGEVTAPTAVERWRLNFPPHKAGTPLRLACQCQPLSDCTIIKHKGFWGELHN